MEIICLEVLIVFICLLMIKLQKGHIIKIVKMILLELALALSAPAAYKTQYFFYLSFNSNLQFINGILQKVFKYFNGTAIVAFLVTFALSASFFLIISTYIQKV